jgi:hypothetical protein
VTPLDPPDLSSPRCTVAGGVREHGEIHDDAGSANVLDLHDGGAAIKPHGSCI